jgi:hypothetical protein
MRRKTLRASLTLDAAIDHEAQLQGISPSQWLREAALLRVAELRLRRGESQELVSELILNEVRERTKEQRETAARAVSAVTLLAPDLLNAMLRRLEGADPAAALGIRHLYGLDAGQYLPEPPET